MSQKSKLVFLKRIRIADQSGIVQKSFTCHHRILSDSETVNEIRSVKRISWKEKT